MSGWRTQSAFTLIEAPVAIIPLTVGMPGLAGFFRAFGPTPHAVAALQSTAARWTR